MSEMIAETKEMIAAARRIQAELPSDDVARFAAKHGILDNIRDCEATLAVGEAETVFPAIRMDLLYQAFESAEQVLYRAVYVRAGQTGANPRQRSGNDVMRYRAAMAASSIAAPLRR